MSSKVPLFPFQQERPFGKLASSSQLIVILSLGIQTALVADRPKTSCRLPFSFSCPRPVSTGSRTSFDKWGERTDGSLQIRFIASASAPARNNEQGYFSFRLALLDKLSLSTQCLSCRLRDGLRRAYTPCPTIYGYTRPAQERSYPTPAAAEGRRGYLA